MGAVREWNAEAADADCIGREPRPAFGHHWQVRVQDTVGRQGWIRAVPGLPHEPALSTLSCTGFSTKRHSLSLFVRSREQTY